mmetsp:Transcript_128977/g.237285  ORF Transcript_128977/g.237285 Transcript_128977/m.237285 type:complete len:226 (-) Transcript_128977:887-1564(-)
MEGDTSGALHRVIAGSCASHAACMSDLDQVLPILLLDQLAGLLLRQADIRSRGQRHRQSCKDTAAVARLVRCSVCLMKSFREDLLQVGIGQFRVQVGEGVLFEIVQALHERVCVEVRVVGGKRADDVLELLGLHSQDVRLSHGSQGPHVHPKRPQHSFSCPLVLLHNPCLLVHLLVLQLPTHGEEHARPSRCFQVTEYDIASGNVGALNCHVTDLADTLRVDVSV